MDFGKEAIEKIEQMTLRNMTVAVEGRVYSAVGLKPVMYVPQQETLTVHNLRGFCGFINNDIDGSIAARKMLIVVDSPKKVRLISECDEHCNRVIPVEAEIDHELKTFSFGQFMSQEAFAIAFRSLFERKEGDDFEYVLSYSQKLVGGTVINGEDDGITQEVTVKRGLSGALKENVALKPVVKLSPYRTFREVEQPESEFLLRVRLSKEEAPMVGLFEADGGNWINQATQNIVDYIQSLVTGIPVIA